MNLTKETLKLISNYTTPQWEDWIDDIIHYKIAYPISNLSGESDDLFEIVVLMQRYNISTKFYEKAFINTLNKTLPLAENKDLIYRLLSVLVASKFSQAKKHILNLFFNNNIITIKYILGKTLNALSRLPLTNDEVMKINERLVGIGKLIQRSNYDEVLVLNYFRFLRLHQSENKFFSGITWLLKNDSKKDLNYVLTDALYEFYVNNKEIFYQYLVRWIICDFSQIKSNKRVIPFLKSVQKFIKHSNRIKDIENATSNQGKRYQDANSLLNLIIGKKKCKAQDLGPFVEEIIGLGGKEFVENVFLEEKIVSRLQMNFYNGYLMLNDTDYKIKNRWLLGKINHVLFEYTMKNPNKRKQEIKNEIFSLKKNTFKYGKESNSARYTAS